MASRRAVFFHLHAQHIVMCVHTTPLCVCTPHCVHAHHIVCVHTMLCTPCRGIHFSQISLQSHVTTHLSQSEGSILSNLSDLVRNCEISPKIFPLFKEQSCYNSSAKNPAHQVNEVQVTTPKPSTTWDLKAAMEWPSTQEDQSEWLTAGGTKELTPTATNPECPQQHKVRNINHLTMATRGPTQHTFQAKVRQTV